VVGAVITGATGVVTKDLKKNFEAIPGKHSIDLAILGTSHIIRKVLQSETGSLRGGYQHLVQKEKCQVENTCYKRQ
jgi:hypothetical protein